MEIYQVNSDGDDAHPDGPWRTVEKVASEIAAGRFLPGDQVLFRDGDTFPVTERFIVGGSCGVENAPIVLGRYGYGPRPILDLGGRQLFVGRYQDSPPADFIRWTGLELRNVRRNMMMRVHGCRGWELDDLHLHDAVADGGWCSLLQIRYASDILVANLTGKDCEGEGLYFGTEYGSDPADLVERVTVRDTVISGCRNEAVDTKNTSQYCVFDNLTIEDCGANEGQQVGLNGIGHVARGLRVLNPPASLRASVRIGNYDVPNGAGYGITLADSFIEGQFGFRDGHPMACVRMYQHHNAVCGCMLVNSQAGISAWATESEPTQAIENIGFSNVETWIDYVSNESCFLVSNLWEVSEMSAVSELQLVITSLQAEISRIEQVIADLRALDTDADAAVVEAREALDAAQVVADKIEVD